MRSISVEPHLLRLLGLGWLPSERKAQRQPRAPHSGGPSRRSARIFSEFVRCSRIARWIRLLRRRSQREVRLRALLPQHGGARLPTLAARICPLLAQGLIARSAREDRAWRPLPSSLTRRRKACLLVRSSRTAARDPGRGGARLPTPSRAARSQFDLRRAQDAHDGSNRRRKLRGIGDSRLWWPLDQYCGRRVGSLD